MKRYIKPVVRHIHLHPSSLLSGSDIGFTNEKGDNTQPVLSKGGYFFFDDDSDDDFSE